MRKLIKKYVIVGNLQEGKCLLPSPPSRVPSPFILYLSEEQKKLKQDLQQKIEQRDIIKLLNQQYKNISQEQKKQYSELYQVSLLKYMQEKRIYEQSFRYSKNNGIKKVDQAYMNMKRSEKRQTKIEEMHIEQIRENFGKFQFELSKIKISDATPQELDVANQVLNLVTLHQLQIKINCLEYKIPDLFNSYKFRQKCKKFALSFLRSVNQDYTFQKYLIEIEDMKQEELINYNQQLKELSEKLNDDPRNVELAIILLVEKPKKKEEESRTRKKGVTCLNNFVEVLAKFIIKEP
ncbi:unnamed protein product [Paramecium sonneborni]|uniref:HMG box domain-containing protein n=1 Tax=Paramecium sonneborni TaxID=65129 RepID=A0A8S1MC82_9CILI|nr:unnamed protein product [Paramecium sonneborni]